MSSNSSNFEINREMQEIGDTLSSITGMSDIRAQICDIGGKILATEDDCMLVSCKDVVEASRRIRGSISNVVIGQLDNETLFLRRTR